MTPFQALLADQEALDRYVEISRKLPEQEDFPCGDFVWWDGMHRFGKKVFPADAHTKNPAKPGVYVIQRAHGNENNWWGYVTQGEWVDGRLLEFTIRRLGDSKPNMVRLRSDVSAWMMEPEWRYMKMRIIIGHGVMGLPDRMEEPDWLSRSEHMHLACGEAVMDARRTATDMDRQGALMFYGDGK